MHAGLCGEMQCVGVGDRAGQKSWPQTGKDTDYYAKEPDSFCRHMGATNLIPEWELEITEAERLIKS